MSKRIVVFGAGNIGRSFIGQVFARGGYEVVFVDVDPRIVDALNRDNAYRVIIKDSGQPDKTILVEGVRAVHGKEVQSVVEQLVSADLAATSVGAGALQFIAPVIAQALEERMRRGIGRPLDIILAENLRNASGVLSSLIAKCSPSGSTYEHQLGLVETSIGKMVPLMENKEDSANLLDVYAEPYNNLIVDARGFKNEIPNIPDIDPKVNIAAFVDRKLFIHNLGHAAAAYLGSVACPEAATIWEALAHPEVLQKARRCMVQAAEALSREYPQDLPIISLYVHIDDLLSRFANKALGDTVYRVGRDLYRKLDKNDRLVGAMLLCKKHGLPCDAIAEVVVAACSFRARDWAGNELEKDRDFLDMVERQGMTALSAKGCHLFETEPVEREVIAEIGQAWEKVVSGVHA